MALDSSPAVAVNVPFHACRRRRAPATEKRQGRQPAREHAIDAPQVFSWLPRILRPGALRRRVVHLPGKRRPDPILIALHRLLLRLRNPAHEYPNPAAPASAHVRLVLHVLGHLKVLLGAVGEVDADFSGNVDGGLPGKLAGDLPGINAAARYVLGWRVRTKAISSSCTSGSVASVSALSHLTSSLRGRRQVVAMSYCLIPIGC